MPAALGDFMILKAVRESDGFAIAVSDEDIHRMVEGIGHEDGLLLCPEGAATAAACKVALERGLISVDDTIVLFNTATGLKYPMPEVTSLIDKDTEIDYRMFR